ncbi:hypothetical protein AB6A40_001512 [Gnathostoma spinigerum]|uniref:Major facilitator superfamily (MFS) profile domain-containing protein n=1 Tax=Gnathostoma spinigerum TaxID=75299 RepID=A0ABD6ED93_9BILA
MTTLSFSWTMVAMPLMCSAFITDDGTCEDNVTICNAENRTSLSSEFSLVGESKYRAEWSTSALLIGNMIGASVLTHLSDRSGRRPVLIASLLLLGTLGILTALSPTLNMITFGRFLQGICSPGVSLVGWVLAFESIPSSLRGFTTFVFGATWVLGYCLIAPLAYFTDNWRTLMLASTAPAIVLAILYMLVIPESLHFLITSGQKSAAIRWVKTAQSYKCDNRQKILLNEVEQMLACSTKMRESSAEAVASKRERQCK